MYSVVLTIHSWMRWLTLGLATAATLNASRPLIEGAVALPGRWWDTFLMLAVDLQVFFGLVLYFGLSPFTKEAMAERQPGDDEPRVAILGGRACRRDVSFRRAGEDGSRARGQRQDAIRRTQTTTDLLRDRHAGNAGLDSLAGSGERTTALQTLGFRLWALGFGLWLQTLVHRRA